MCYYTNSERHYIWRRGLNDRLTMDLANIPQIAPFHIDSDVTSLAQRWKRWSDRFDNLMVAMNVTDNARKKALLLHLAGDAVFSIFEGLVIANIADDAA